MCIFIKLFTFIFLIIIIIKFTVIIIIIIIISTCGSHRRRGSSLYSVGKTAGQAHHLGILQ